MQIEKLIAPIIITTLLVGYFTLYIIGTLFMEDMSIPLNVFLMIIPVGLILLAIKMLIERIKEVKGGEEDDLSKY